MKKHLAALLALVTAFSLAACSGKPAPAGESAAPAASAAADAGTESDGSGGVRTAGISMPTRFLERWNLDGDCLRARFEADGYNVLLTYSDNDKARQNSDVQSLIDAGVDILIIGPIDGSSLTQTLSNAKAAGIPVISYDRLIMDSDAISYYVSFDNYAVGVLQGEFIKEALDLDHAAGPFNVEWISGDPGDNNARYFFGGSLDTLKPYLDAGKLVVPSGRTTFEQVATPGWATDTACEQMRETLSAYYADGTRLDAAICSNDSTALGVARAITSDYTGGNMPIVTGQDGDLENLRNLVDGIQAMTVYKNISDEAGVTLAMANAILSGQKPDASLLNTLEVAAHYDDSFYYNGAGVIPSFLLLPWTVTQDNLQDLVDTGLYHWDSDGRYLESGGG